MSFKNIKSYILVHNEGFNDLFLFAVMMLMLFFLISPFMGK
jgi:hypothetical protein